MNIALALQHKFMMGLQRLIGETLPAPMAPGALRPQAATSLRTQPKDASSQPRQAAKSPMPLRVLRVVDKDQPRSCTGRMVISGRMADVCAELDRLAAREAALH